MAFAGSAPSQSATPLYGAYVTTQPGYGMGTAMPYAVVPAYGMPTVPSHMAGYHNAYSADATAVAQGMENLSINPNQQMWSGMSSGSQGYPSYGVPQKRDEAGQHNSCAHPPPRGMQNHQQMPMQGHIQDHTQGHMQRHTQGHMQGHMQSHMQGHMQRPGERINGYPGPPYERTPAPGLNGSPQGPGRGGRGGRAGRMGPLPYLQNGYGPAGHPPPQRRRKVQRGLEDNVRRTVYISYIDQQVTEESLASFFADCGTVMDCRICGDPNSAMRFAFIEFLEEAGARQALSKTGQTLGTGQLRVLPSKTAIVPVNKELMPRSHEELERCSRTVYVANIDKKVKREDVRDFFERLCGKINKIRLLGDMAHSTRIAFIEFIQAESAMAALNCSGALLGSLPLRVSPSKTPVRSDKEDKEARLKQQGAGPRSETSGADTDQDQQVVGEQQVLETAGNGAMDPVEDAAVSGSAEQQDTSAMPQELTDALQSVEGAGDAGSGASEIVQDADAGCEGDSIQAAAADKTAEAKPAVVNGVEESQTILLQ